MKHGLNAIRHVDASGRQPHNRSVIKAKHVYCNAAVAGLLMLALCACGGAPPPSAAAKPGIQILSETTDQSGRCIVSIKLEGAVSEAQAGAAAESVINSRRSRCPSITVKSYIGSPDETPYMVSSLEGTGIKHQLGHQSQQQRIPTH